MPCVTDLVASASLELLPHVPQCCGCCPCARSLGAKNTHYKCYGIAVAFFSLYEIPPCGLCYHSTSASTCRLGLTGPWNSALVGTSANPILPTLQSSPWGHLGGSDVLFSGASSRSYSLQGLASVLLPLFRCSPDLARGGCQCPPTQSS